MRQFRPALRMRRFQMTRRQMTMQQPARLAPVPLHPPPKLRMATVAPFAPAAVAVRLLAGPQMRHRPIRKATRRLRRQAA